MTLKFSAIPIQDGRYPVGNDTIPVASPAHQRRLKRTTWISAELANWNLFEKFITAGGLNTQAQNSEAWSTVNSVDEFVIESLELSLKLQCEQPWADVEDFKQPLTNLSWHQAKSIAKFFDARLPSEVEWEVAMGKCQQDSRITQHWEYLQEWTADAFSPKYWRADFSKSCVAWDPSRGGEVTVRGSTPDELHKHVCYRSGADPSEIKLRRGFRLAWDTPPALAE